MIVSTDKKIQAVRESLSDECLAVVEDRLRDAHLDIVDVEEYARDNAIQCSPSDSIHSLVNKVVLHVFNNQG